MTIGNIVTGIYPINRSVFTELMGPRSLSHVGQAWLSYPSRVLPTVVGGGRARPPLYFPRPALRRHLAGVIGRFCDPERYSTLASQLTSRHNAVGVHQLKYSFRRSRPQTVPVWG